MNVFVVLLFKIVYFVLVPQRLMPEHLLPSFSLFRKFIAFCGQTHLYELCFGDGKFITLS
jgi:hypothetical protein